MVCVTCGWETAAEARFCGGCGAPVAQRCPACGAETGPKARFCEGCGASLAARPADAGAERKVVTIVFADLIGSTALHERLDAEAVRQFMEGYYAAMRGAVEAHGGRVTQVMGDGVKAVFGAPRVAEDDAIRAVRAALEMQRAFPALADEQRGRVGTTGLRVAVNTGEVVADDASEIIGDPVNVAARLQEQGQDGDVVIGGSTQRIVASLVTLERLGSFALKGRAEPVTAWRVVSLEVPAGAAATPFVGRDEELRRLAAVYDAAIAAPAARLAVLLGSPGLGKSRLLAELGRQLEGRATVLTALCNPAGGATFAPLAEALRAHFARTSGAGDGGLRSTLDALVGSGDDVERAKIAVGMDALLSGTPALPEEIFFVVRRLLSALAAEQPVVLAIDDVQWAEPLLLDFTEHLVQWGAGIPLLVLVAARPELRDTRSSFTTAGGLVSDVVTLAGLDAGAAMRLAANVVGADTLPAAVAGRVLATSEGNPLFLRELVRMLVNDGTLQREGERWTLAIDLAALEMPPTIQALLAARIERLRPEERLVLERAAVVGRQFSRAAVTHLLPREAHADLDARLEALRRSELIEADAGWLLGEPALRFHHVLIRDAAYRRVLRGTRADLHARFADWLEARAGESVDHEETIGWHLEQAHQHLRELGPLDAKGHALGERAGRRLAAAGQRALARDDLEPAASLLGRALDCLGDADPSRGALALDWCEAVLSAGDVGTASRAIAELGRFTAGSERLRAWHTCFTSQLAALADPKALRASAGAVVAAAEALAAAGDLAGEAKAHAVHADALARLGEIGAQEAALDKALAAARRAHDRRRANAVLAGAPLAALWGPSPVTRASGRCLDVVRVLRITQGAPAVEALALRCQAVLETLRGRSEAARRMIASSRRLVEELGITQRLLEVDASAGLIELFEGDAVAAERWLRPAYEGFRERGLAVEAARVAALLGRAVLAQGRADEAEALSHESEALAGDDFQAAIDWRGALSLALASRGEHAAALELARAAVEIAAGTDDLLDHAAARSALAVALRAAGRSREADAEEARAIELWEQKGATLLVERARRGALGAASAERVPAERADLPRSEHRRVRENAATVNLRAIAAAVAARNTDAFELLWADDATLLNHSTGVELDRSQLRRSQRSFLGADGFTLVSEPLATLGDTLVLSRESMSASGVARGNLDVGRYERESILLAEVDAEGRRRRTESFPPRRLGDALARLYERHAELLPDGPERTRAAAAARVVAGMNEPADPDRWRTAVAPAIEFVDRRTLGVGAVHGADALLENIRPLRDLSGEYAHRVEDVFAARSYALVVRWTNYGTERASGGAYERQYLTLILLGAQGLITRVELFDSDRVDEVLARFDELTAEPPAPIRPRVRANAATANVARLDAAIAAGDADTLPVLFADEMQTVNHRLAGGDFGRQGALASWRSLLGAEAPTCRHESLATLGDSLVLCRQSVSASGFVGRTFDVGAYERESFTLVDVDSNGGQQLSEYFAADKLGDAVARLYERYADLLPDGPEKRRAAATARSVAALPLVGAYDLERATTAYAADIEYVDHRTVGFGSVRGAEALRDRMRALLDLTEDSVGNVTDVLALRPDAFLVRWTHSGIDRAGGGAFERRLCHLWVFGADGLVTRGEQFEAEQESEALARFDALTVGAPAKRPVRRVRPNAATAQVARFVEAISLRDADALPRLLTADSEVIDHLNGFTYGGPRQLEHYRRLIRTQGLSYQYDPLATLGDCLALFRVSISGSGAAGRTFDVGAFDSEQVVLVEVDVHGRRRRQEIFAASRLGDALARLSERYAELLPEGAARARAAAIARSAAMMAGPHDLDRYAAALAPDLEFVDHRLLGLQSVLGREALLRWLGSLVETADDLATHVDDILALESDRALVRRTTTGRLRASGGPFETQTLQIVAAGADGLAARIEWFDLDRLDEALARFDELTFEPPPARPVRRRILPNAATAHAARLDAAIAARDTDALPALFAEDAVSKDHKTGLAWDRSGILFSLRALVGAESPKSRLEPVATLGDALALMRWTTSASAFAGGRFDVGAYEREEIALLEVDGQGRRRRSDLFPSDRLGDAVAHLYERHAELLPEGPERTRATANARTIAVYSGPIDVERWVAAWSRDVEYVDRRTLGAGSATGIAAFRVVLESLLETASDMTQRFDDVLALRPDAWLLRNTNFGTDRSTGGAYERPYLLLMVTGADGLVTRIEQFDVDRDAEALARFVEVECARELEDEEPEPPPANRGR